MYQTDKFVRFRHRHDDGERLDQKLLHYKEAENTIVIALPRGGVVVGYDDQLALSPTSF